MNINTLKQAEFRFLHKYPGGFLHPEMQALAKKHRMDKLITLAQASLSKQHFKDSQTVAENMVKIVSRSSMVSMFEKPKFRDYMRSLSDKKIKALTNGLKDFLHGNSQQGFEAMVDSLRPAKLAKWSLITIIPNYYYPDEEVFVKPTTAKGVIQYFELQGVEYKPAPTWDFYQNYRDLILTMKAQVDPLIAPNNAAFGGFLMMSMETF